MDEQAGLQNAREVILPRCLCSARESAMTSNSRALKTFNDIRSLMAPIKCNKKYCHTFAFLARVWTCEERYVRDLQLSSRGISEKRFQLVRIEVARILDEETQQIAGH